MEQAAATALEHNGNGWLGIQGNYRIKTSKNENPKCNIATKATHP
jgi:hypothetical protein